MADQSLFLDSSIRDWVLLPITLVMVLVGVLRHNVTQLLDSPPKKSNLKAIREQRILMRSQLLRANRAHISPSSFLARRSFLLEALANGQYLQIKEDDGNGEGGDSGPKNPLTDPGAMDGMMEQMKKSMVMMVPQTVIMGWINFFFSGFILIKLPFPLTLRFKRMLQSGIETPDMDVTWVSSISWYFLNLFGLNAIYRLVLGEGNAADGTRDMAAMSPLAGAMGGGMGGPTAPDFSKLHNAERDNLELVGLDLQSQAESISEFESGNRGGGKKQVGKGGGNGDGNGVGAYGKLKMRWVADGIEDRILNLYTIH